MELRYYSLLNCWETEDIYFTDLHVPSVNTTFATVINVIYWHFKPICRGKKRNCVKIFNLNKKIQGEKIRKRRAEKIHRKIMPLPSQRKSKCYSKVKKVKIMWFRRAEELFSTNKKSWILYPNYPVNFVTMSSLCYIKHIS